MKLKLKRVKNLEDSRFTQFLDFSKEEEITIDAITRPNVESLVQSSQNSKAEEEKKQEFWVISKIKNAAKSFILNPKKVLDLRSYGYYGTAFIKIGAFKFMPFVYNLH